MARRKAHPSAWVVVICLLFVALGAATRQWQEILTGATGILAMTFIWIAFRYVVYCDVNRKNKPGFCERRIKGALFGCNDHYWEKVIAWTRYLGTGYIARMMHITLPILRWQAGALPPPSLVPPSTVWELKVPSSVSETAENSYAPTPFVQAMSIYVGLFSGIATIAGFGLSIAGVVK